MARLSVVLLCVAAFLNLSCSATMNKPSSEPELLRLSYDSSATGQERQYLVYLPRGYHDEPDRNWPVIVFLHGGGEVGDDKEQLDYVLLHGPLGEAWVQQRDLPFIMIGPQLPVFDSPGRLIYTEGVPKPRRTPDNIPPRPSDQRPDGPFDGPGAPGFSPGPLETRLKDGWWKIQDEVLAMLDTVIHDYRGDETRVYLTGLSLGGWGTFELAAAYPKRWAAIAPIAGAGDPASAKILADNAIPTWILASGRDDAVPEAWVSEMAEAINAAGHPTLRYTIHEDAGHLVWIRVYAGKDLYDWFLQHQLGVSGH